MLVYNCVEKSKRDKKSVVVRSTETVIYIQCSIYFVIMVHDIPITFYRVGVLGSMYGQYSGL